ncbi:TRAP transporter substrate-binding protein DctP [Ramlibacter sp. AW1]|uniref:TRAP transporter substrate-binding protein DctP n=1 Tax=Ramlibacter aurantiacus TaxID=2801330 RepID=A0A936ZUR4_9BURK|nr:TRAP transporter substrate-binding protein DctP [Ramlibacter aurantiacus]MBL0422951.1 TRAP transporter substrate-binding protein DctP [Ramlibacter aurantiacus]
MRRQVLKVLAGCLLAGASLGTFAQQQQPIKLKFAWFSPDRERLFLTVVKPFAENIKKETNGQVEIELYPNGALGRAPQQQAQMVLDGVADFAMVVPTFTPGRFPESEVLESAGLFRDLAEGTRVFTKLVSSGVIKDYDQFVPIAVWSTPPFSIHTNFPVNSLNDLKGKRIRGSGVLQLEALKGLGMNTVGMAPTEVAEAIGRRTIDGTISQPAVVFDFGLDRVTSHDYFIRLGITPLTVMMNKAKFDSLPPNAQAAIRKYGLDWMARTYIESMVPYNASLVERMEKDPKRKVTRPTPAEEAQVQKVFDEVRAGWVAKSPRNAEIYKAVTEEIRKDRAQHGAK